MAGRAHPSFIWVQASTAREVLLLDDTDVKAMGRIRKDAPNKLKEDRSLSY